MCRATQSLMEKVPNYNQGETICNRIKGNKNCIVFLAILTHNCFAIVVFKCVCVCVCLLRTFYPLKILHGYPQFWIEMHVWVLLL